MTLDAGKGLDAAAKKAWAIRSTIRAPRKSRIAKTNHDIQPILIGAENSITQDFPFRNSLATFFHNNSNFCLSIPLNQTNKRTICQLLLYVFLICPGIALDNQFCESSDGKRLFMPF